MSRIVLSSFVAAALLAPAGVAVAGETPNGSSEGHESAPYACGDPSAPAPDDAGDCEAGEETYTVWVHDNEVRCGDDLTGSSEPAVLSGGVYGSPTDGGGGELCTDEDNVAPIQGRVLASGSTGEGLTVSVDGDASNPAPGDGWVSVHVDGDGPSVRCGDPAGSLDSQAPSDEDSQEDCG